MSDPDKTDSAGKSKHANRTTWRKGQSGNPAGAPKRGESWRELIAKLGDFDGPTAAAHAGFLSGQFKKLPQGVTLKELVVLRVYAALIDDPQPGLLNAFMERVEGKVKEQVELTGSPNAPVEIKLFDYAAAVAAIAPTVDDDSAS